MRRIDPKKIREIIKLRQDCKASGIEGDEAVFTEYRGVPDATRLEHAAANYPLFTEDKSRWLKHDMVTKHNQCVRLFNKSVKQVDMEIIGVPYKIQNVQGKIQKIVFDEIALGDKAIKAGDACDAPINGYRNKKKRLYKIGTDKRLKSKHDKKWLEIQKKLNKERK